MLYPENLTLVEKDYEPLLAMLPEIRAIDPAWATCDTVLPLHDPPIALQKADSLEVKTTEIKTLFTPSPSPAASLPARLPAATATSRANQPQAQDALRLAPLTERMVVVLATVMEEALIRVKSMLNPKGPVGWHLRLGDQAIARRATGDLVFSH